MSKNDFEAVQSQIEAIDSKNVQSPFIPIAIYLQEAEDLAEWCVADLPQLIKAGMENYIVTDLSVRTGALRYVQSIWQKEYKSLEEVQKEWAAQSVGAYELRDELVHYFLHAYRKNPDLLAKAQKIAEGTGHADMIQDLSDFSVLGKANTEPLKKVGVDLTLLDTAADLSESLSNLLAKANGAKQLDNKTKILRDKAFTYLKEAVDEIRRHGQFVFYRDPNRLKGYVSNYRKRRTVSKAVNSAKV